ncbi:TRAP transporter small permease [Rhodovulum strictum]|uniref:TRAP transporter small permease protein n=1 Tax=Rhodovulum strictum TaxID=58314 RepID=A0A844B0A4_9RHOB|nr:TRAP transporter small permease subunit [Rhodovulum strictum]
MTRISDIFRRLFGLAAGLSLALVFLIVFVNALRRYLFGASVPWGEELPVYLTIYGTMSGLALAYMNDSHIRFTILLDGLSMRLRERILAAGDVLAIAVGLTLARAGHLFAERRGGIDASGLVRVSRDLAEATGIEALAALGRMGSWQYAIAFGGAALALAALLRLAERLARLRAV